MIEGIHTQTHRLMGGIYAVRHCDRLSCHNIHKSFIKAGSDIQKLMAEGFTDTHTHRHTESMVIA
jgi:hypothetical protein